MHAHNFYCFFAILCNQDIITAHHEISAQNALYRRIIIDDEYAFSPGFHADSTPLRVEATTCGINPHSTLVVNHDGQPQAWAPTMRYLAAQRRNMNLHLAFALPRCYPGELQ